MENKNIDKSNDKRIKNIEYVDTNTENLVNMLILGYEKICKRKLYPADPIRLFILWIANIIIQERISIDDSAKQNLPRYARSEYLDELVAFLNDTIKRLPPQAAKTKLKYTLSIKRDTATIISAGNRVTVDGEINFHTVKDLIIQPGQTNGEIEAICEKKGTIGNGFAPGQINQLVDFVPFLEAVENVTTSAGGAEEEDDQSLYDRYREALATYSTAGPTGAYSFYTKAANASISDVKALSPTPGVAEIRVLLKNGELPGEEVLKSIQDILSDESIRPFTDKVVVKAPEKKEYKIDFTYFSYKEDVVGASNTEKTVAKAVEDYTKWQSQKMGRDINPSMLNAFLIKAGAKRVIINEPQFAEVEENAVAVLIDTKIKNGGAEDE